MCQDVTPWVTAWFPGIKASREKGHHAGHPSMLGSSPPGCTQEDQARANHQGKHNKSAPQADGKKKSKSKSKVDSGSSGSQKLVVNQENTGAATAQS